MSGDSELVYANGIDATTGGYLLPPMPPAEIAELARGQETDADLQAAVTKARGASSEHLGLPFDVDPVNLAQAGWGVVFAADEDPHVKAALAPLLEARRGHVTDAARLKELDYVAGESRRRWLARHGVAAGNVDPTCVPFYLLVVGCPAKIPFGFCRELSVEYAVGLLSFDTPAEYAAYAASVVAADSNEVRPRSRQLTFFSPRHPFDPATQLSADQLVKPLVEGNLAGRVRCRFELISGEAATHALSGVLARSGATAPALLFTASHGMGFAAGHADQRTQQGRSSVRTGPVRGRVRSTAASTSPGTTCRTTSTSRACSPSSSPASAAARRRATASRIRQAPIRRSLPRLRSRQRFRSGCSRIRAGARSGALRTSSAPGGDSIVESGAGPQLIPFENAIGNVLAGRPIGLALKDFNERFAALSVSLAGLLEQIGDGLIVPDRQLAKAWIQRNDAEGYALFGDPAARLGLEQARLT